MPEFVETRLYAHYSAFLPLNELLYLEKEIRYAEEEGADVNWEARDINGAMIWDETPQGHQFWVELNDKYYKLQKAKGNNV